MTYNTDMYIQNLPRSVQHLINATSHNGNGKIIQMKDLSPFLMNNHVQSRKLIAINGDPK